MSIYGNGYRISAVNEAAYWESRKGLKAISKARGSAETVNVYAEDGTFYVATSDLQRFMEASELFDVNEAVTKIADVNNINESEITICYDGCDDYFMEAVQESGVMLEASAEDDSMTVKQASKWFDKMISAARSKSESIEEIDSKIKFLNRTVEKMERALQTKDGKVKYMFKSLIPFNAIYRLVKKEDKQAGMAWLAGLAGSLVGLGIIQLPVRYALWADMIKDQISKTKDAIAYLEKEKEKLKKQK